MENVFHQIETEEILYLMMVVCRTVKMLNGEFGYFKVTPSMVGLNKNGICKVWINEKHGVNTVEYPL